MHTAQQFSGSAWLAYDRAFRRQAAAYKLTDWSHMNPELFHFHVSGCVSVEHPTVAPPIQSVSPTELSRPADVVEALGTASSSTLCHSWNASRCSSQFYVVVFATRVTFRDVPLCIVVWWRIGSPRNHQLPNPRNLRISNPRPGLRLGSIPRCGWGMKKNF